MSSPTVGTTSVAGAASGTSVSISKPAINAWPTLLVATWYGPASSSPVPPDTSWIPVGTNSWIRQALGSDPSSFTWTWTTSGKFIMTLTPVSGLSGPFGLDAVLTNANGSAPTVIAPSISTTKSPTDVLFNVYCSNAASAITVPGSQTAIATAATSANGVASAAGWENLAALGATGTRTATSGAATSNGWSFAFSPVIGSIGMGVDLSGTQDRFLAVANWTTGVAAIGNPNLGITYPGPNRLQPYWLADTGVGVDGSSVGSTNITQLGVGAACEALMSADVFGSISGSVKIGGVAASNVLMLLIYRANGHVIKTTRTASDGTYSFSGLDRTVAINNGYAVVCMDPNGLAQQYNSGIADRITPG